MGSRLASGRAFWKLRRDKREFSSSAGRERLRRALLVGDSDSIRSAAARACDDPQAQVDFAVAAAGVVDSLSDAQRRDLHELVSDLGLIDSLLEQLRSPNATDRGRAAFLLGELRVGEAEQQLPALLADRDPDVRLVACAELGGIASRTAALALIAGLMAGDLADERIVERLGGRWAVPAMVSVLEDPGLARSLAPGDGKVSPRWRPSVARALGVAGDPRAELTLARLLDSEQVEERIAAARALGPSGSSASVTVLVATLDDPAWEVRAQAAKSLIRHSGGWGEMTRVGLESPTALEA